MQAHALRPHKTGYIVAALFVLLLALSACGGSTNQQAKGSPTAGSSGSASPTPIPGVRLGVLPCPNAVSIPAHWGAIVGAQPNVSQVESVSCGNLIGNPSLQALVNVRAAGTGSILSVYVYTNITDPAPTKLFQLQGLARGDAKISYYNTIITGEVDAASKVNNNQPNAALTVDLFREYKWSDGAGTFVQITFPGLFPDLTRYQAEADQAQVNQGQQPWKLDAAQTAAAFAATLLKWPAASPTTIVSGGGTHDIEAVVSVKGPGVTGSSVTLTLDRLEGNSNGGIWEVVTVAASASTISITAPAPRDLLNSPITVTGTGPAFEGQIGNVVVLDHLYTDIGHATAQGATGNGNTTFSTQVTYHSTLQTGAEEGIVALLIPSNANGSIATAVMLKELLGAV